MSPSSPHQSEPERQRPLTVLVAGTVAALVVALLVFTLLMRPPQDFVAMSAFLGITAFVSSAARIAAARLG